MFTFITFMLHHEAGFFNFKVFAVIHIAELNYILLLLTSALLGCGWSVVVGTFWRRVTK